MCGRLHQALSATRTTQIKVSFLASIYTLVYDDLATTTAAAVCSAVQDVDDGDTTPGIDVVELFLLSTILVLLMMLSVMMLTTNVGDNVVDDYDDDDDDDDEGDGNDEGDGSEVND